MNTDEIWDFKNPVCLHQQVHSHHIDGLGHTNNCEYLKWCEAAAWTHSESLGLGLDAFQKSGFAMATAKTELNYLAPTFEGDELIVGTWIVQTDGKYSTDRQYQIIRPKDGAVILRGMTKFVCINLQSGKIARMPEHFSSGYRSASLSL